MIKTAHKSHKYNERRYSKLSIRRRMAEIRKLRVNPSESCKLASSKVTSKDKGFQDKGTKEVNFSVNLFVESFKRNDGLTKDEKDTLVCPHHIVSSAHIYKLIFKVYGIKDLHSCYFTGLNRRYGRIAEEYVLRKHSNMIKGKCIFSKQLPMLCSSPDAFLSILMS